MCMLATGTHTHAHGNVHKYNSSAVEEESKSATVEEGELSALNFPKYQILIYLLTAPLSVAIPLLTPCPFCSLF